jgi:hypothetical protein
MYAELGILKERLHYLMNEYQLEHRGASVIRLTLE